MRRTRVIVGGVAGGASCAARLRRNRENMNIIVLERGPQVSLANCGLLDCIGGVIEKGQDLLLAISALFKDRFAIEVHTGQGVVAIDRVRKVVQVDELRLRFEELPRDKLIRVLCGVGIRSYSAVRLLVQRGFRATLLSVGTSTWQQLGLSTQHAPKTKGGG